MLRKQARNRQRAVAKALPGRKTMLSATPVMTHAGPARPTQVKADEELDMSNVRIAAGRVRAQKLHTVARRCVGAVVCHCARWRVLCLRVSVPLCARPRVWRWGGACVCTHGAATLPTNGLGAGLYRPVWVHCSPMHVACPRRRLPSRNVLRELANHTNFSILELQRLAKVFAENSMVG